MSDRPYDYDDEPVPPGPSSGAAGPDSTREVAAEEAKGVAQDAAQEGRAVADTAKDEAQQVVSEAKDQAQQLFQQVRSEVGGQASGQQQKVAGVLHSLAGELRGMAEGSQEQQGPATGLARQAAGQVDDLAGWLESHEPADLLGEVRSFARRRPGTFLAAAATVGFLGGRMMRGLQADSRGSADGSAGAAAWTGGSAPASGDTPVPGPADAVTPHAAATGPAPAGTPLP